MGLTRKGWSRVMLGAALLATAETFNPTTGLFTSAGSLVQGRYYHTATLVSGKVLLAGGIGTSYTSAELYF
ncbi:MAG: hypothetical protein NTW40_03110 [Acidobacteria bacterium]|nr:hypothetical protein [Acidobacteriota bacterium]